MPASPEKARALHGQRVDVIGAVGQPVYPGIFRVTETGQSLPRVEVIFVRDTETFCQEVPPLVLPAIFASERDGKFAFWDATFRRDAIPRTA